MIHQFFHIVDFRVAKHRTACPFVWICCSVMFRFEWVCNKKIWDNIHVFIWLMISSVKASNHSVEIMNICQDDYTDNQFFYLNIPICFGNSKHWMQIQFDVVMNKKISNHNKKSKGRNCQTRTKFSAVTLFIAVHRLIILLVS